MFGWTVGAELAIFVYTLIRILSHMPRKKAAGASSWVDPDDAPELTDEFFRRADVYDGSKLVRRGRPPSPAPKRPVSLRLDPDVVAHFRRGGRGWQSRINAVLRKAAKLPTEKRKKA
jgi:uncharacterized protein (DUF4415 family)